MMSRWHYEELWARLFTVYPKKYAQVFALLYFVVVIHWLIFPYPSGLLHWHCGNLTIAPVPAKQPWWIWINTSCEFIMNDCITTTKQSTTKPCAYFLGYTLWGVLYRAWIRDYITRCSIIWPYTHFSWTTVETRAVATDYISMIYILIPMPSFQLLFSYSISQEICTRFCCALLCCGYAIVHNEFTWSIYPYSSGLLCWHWGNR